MRLLLTAFYFLMTSCDSIELESKQIVGKWAPTYQQKTLNPDGSWSPWQTINTFAPLPQIEFTSDGKFLSDNKAGASCCYAGNTFTLTGNRIDFFDKLTCSNCEGCASWYIEESKNDTLILKQCTIQSKLIKTK
jgi:hypothetical protein